MDVDHPLSTESSRVEQLVAKEARIVGIRNFETPTLEAVDRRRSQLWTVAFAALVSMASAVALLASNSSKTLGFAHRFPFRIGTIVLVVALAIYVMEKERHLRRLSRLLMNERVLAAALSNRLKELAMLYEAGKAMNSVLVVDDVLHLILTSASELLEASSGSIMLLRGADTLEVVCQVGNTSAEGATVKLGEGIAGRAALKREPLLVQGTTTEPRQVTVESSVCVPLVHRDQLFGVLNLNGSNERIYTPHDIRAVSMFAEHAAIAIANARLYEAERTLAAKLSHQVVHDPLTGVANRTLIHDRLNHALARLPRTDTTVGVLFIDLDNFKDINDQFGHEAGDRALSVLAKRIAASVRPADTVGRLGGDEFVVVCEDLTGEAEAAAIADRVFAALHQPLPAPFADHPLTASIGVAACDQRSPRTAEELLRLADRAMYRAKLAGKDRIVATIATVA